MMRKRDVLYPLRMARYRKSKKRAKPDRLAKASGKLNMKDALSYVRKVKGVFHDQPTKYRQFLKILKDFKSKRIDRTRVVESIKDLFEEHIKLIPGFNVFLPDGCRIALDERRVKRKPVGFEEAMSFVHKIKTTFDPEERVYEKFDGILQMYRNGKDIQEVYDEVTYLFAGHPSLLKTFERFLPESFQPADVLRAIKIRALCRLQMIGWSTLQPRMKSDKDCVDSDHNEDMMKKVHKDDGNATGSTMSC